MIHFLEASNQVLFYYYLLSNLAYLVMLIIALRTSAAHLRHLEKRPAAVDQRITAGASYHPHCARAQRREIDLRSGAEPAGSGLSATRGHRRK